MKKLVISSLTTLTLALGLVWSIPARADQPPAHENQFTGISSDVNLRDKSLTMRHFWGVERFAVASDCKVLMPGNSAATLADLRPGLKLDIQYEDDQGVRVAHTITQERMTYVGDVRAIDPANHVLVVRVDGRNRKFQIAANCTVTLHSDRSGSLTDIQPGDRVTVVYEAPPGMEVASAIAQTSDSFSGSLTAIDADNRTLRARGVFGEKEFNLADGCKIVVNGNTDARIADLHIGDRVTFNYDDNSGVLVANRVGRADAPGSEAAPVARN